MEDWKENDLNVDSLWLFPERGRGGRHTNVYYGNFVPQIPNQLVRRYTAENDRVLELFMGGGLLEKNIRRFTVAAKRCLKSLALLENLIKAENLQKLGHTIRHYAIISFCELPVLLFIFVGFC